MGQERKKSWTNSVSKRDKEGSSELILEWHMNYHQQLQWVIILSSKFCQWLKYYNFSKKKNPTVMWNQATIITCQDCMSWSFTPVRIIYVQNVNNNYKYMDGKVGQ